MRSGVALPIRSPTRVEPRPPQLRPRRHDKALSVRTERAVEERREIRVAQLPSLAGPGGQQEKMVEPT